MKKIVFVFVFVLCFYNIKINAQTIITDESHTISTGLFGKERKSNCPFKITTSSTDFKTNDNIIFVPENSLITIDYNKAHVNSWFTERDSQLMIWYNEKETKTESCVEDILLQKDESIVINLITNDNDLYIIYALPDEKYNSNDYVCSKLIYYWYDSGYGICSLIIKGSKNYIYSDGEKWYFSPSEIINFVYEGYSYSRSEGKSGFSASSNISERTGDSFKEIASYSSNFEKTYSNNFAISLNVSGGGSSIDPYAYTVFLKEFYVDNTPPKIDDIRIEEYQNLWTNKSILLTLQDVTDTESGFSHYEYYESDEMENKNTIPEDVWQKLNGGMYKKDEECKKYVYFRAVDNVGNKSEASDPFFIGIDRTLPVINTGDYNGKWIKEELVISATDDRSGIERFVIDGNECTNPYTLNSSGRHILNAYDNAGNESETKLILMDTIPPVVNIDPSGEYTWNTWTNKDIDIEISASDTEEESGLKIVTYNDGENHTLYEYNDTEDLEYVSRFSNIIFTKEGVNEITATVEDIAGNISNINKIIKIDKISPEILIETDGYMGDWTNTVIPLTITFRDNQSGIDKSSIILTDTNNQNDSSIIKFNEEQKNENIIRMFDIGNDGIHEITIFVNDIAGNISSSSMTVKIDNQRIDSQNISIIPIYNDDVQEYRKRLDCMNITSVGNIEKIQITVNEEGDNISKPEYATINGTRYNFSENSKSIDYDVSTLGSGSYTYNITVTDEAGNESDAKSFVFTIDRTTDAPVAKLISTMNESNDGKDVYITFEKKNDRDTKYLFLYNNKDDFGKSDKSLIIDLDEENPDKRKIKFQKSSDGVYPIYVEGVDENGNHQQTTLYAIWRNKLDVPSVISGYETTENNRIKSYIEIPVQSTESITIDGKTKSLARTYKYFGTKNTDSPIIVNSSNNKIYIEDLKQYLNWNDTENGRKITVYYTENYTADEQEINIYTKEGESNCNVYEIKDSKPVINGNITWPEYATKIIRPEIKSDANTGINFAVDPDGDFVSYKITVTDGKSTNVSYKNNITEGIVIPEEFDVSKGIVIKIEAKGMTSENPEINETTWNTDPAESLIYGSISYATDKIDIIEPTVITNDTNYWIQYQSEWTNSKTAEFTIKDNESGIKEILVTVKQNEKEFNKKTITLNCDKEYLYKEDFGNKSLNGEYYISFTLTDAAGNISHKEYGPVKIDTQQPEIKNFNSDIKADGLVELQLEVTDNNGSGIYQYRYKEKETENWTDWYPYPKNNLINIPSETFTEKTREIQLQLKDNALNESVVYDHNCGDYEPVPEIKSLIFTGINERGFVTNINTFDYSISFADESNITQYSTDWILKDIDGNILPGSPFKKFTLLKQILADGNEYKISVKVTNEYGSHKEKDSETIIKVKTSVPDALSLTAETEIKKGNKHNITIVGGNGGQRSVVLFSKDSEGKRNILHTYKISNSLDLTTVSFPTENFNSEIEAGNTYFYAKSENEAGLITESAEKGPLSLTEFEGLAVYADAYTSGTLHVYWNDSYAETEYYKYYLESNNQKIGDVIQTENRIADIELPSGYDSETKFTVTVQSYSSEDELLYCEKSNDSIYWKKQPEISFTKIPSAVTSSSIQIGYLCHDTIGINRRQYAFEIYEKDAETNSWEWNGLEEDGNRKWIDLNSETEIYDISVLKELKKDSRITNGSRIRVCLKIENNAELYSQIETNAITVDETEPPEPIICDQGDVINQTRENISVDWSTSTNDTESGSTYYWRWYYAGEDNSGALWNEAAWNENTTAQTKYAEITESEVKNSENDGKIIIFEVKAVNGAGLESIAVTDGIKLDSNSPWIENFHIYTSDTKEEMIGTYIKQNRLGDDVYISFTANDVTSRIVKADAILFEVDNEGKFKEKDTTNLDCNENEISGNINISSTIGNEIGKRFLIKLAVEDQAGNKYIKSANSIIQIIGEPVEIKQLEIKADMTGININWMTEGDINWTREYVIVITSSKQNFSPKTFNLTETVCFKTWADLGIEYKKLSSSDYFTVKIKPIGLLSENGKEEQRTLTIDLEEPVFDQTKKRIPEESGLTAWADEITAYVKYKMQISTGTIEWSAWENDIMLVDWQTKKNADSLTIRKNVEELSEIRSKVYWQNKYITLKFRAMNAMGISSTVKEVSCFIDMTPPESVAVSRNWVWTNSFDNLDNIKITGKDGDSGIVSYVSALIPKNIIDKVGIETAIKQNSIESIYSYHSKDQSLSIENIQIPIKGTEEGIYNAVVGIRNGSGIWKYEKSADITVDRTSPSLNRNDSFFNGKHLAKTIIDGKETNIFIVNDENTSLTFRASEESKWSITGEGNLFTGITEQEYKAEINKNINFSGKTEGTVYRLNVELTDKAGNIKTETIYVRYNKAPVVKIKYDDTGVPDERKIIVWPGHSKSIKELFEVSDKEDLSEGDYPLTFKWTSGTGDQSIIWTGGNSKENVFGTNRDYTTTYVQRDRETQVSEYTGTLQVSDCHGKSREITVTVTVENTRNGLLLVDEYWTGEHEVNGMVEIPEGRTLTLSDVNVTMSGYSAGGYVNSGFDVKGILHAQGTVSLNKKSNLSKFKGITVLGNLSGESISINGAWRGITLLPSGNVNLNQLTITNCTTGMHLLGGTMASISGTISNCEEYGVKEDGNGTYSYEGLAITGCGRSRYKDGKAE